MKLIKFNLNSLAGDSKFYSDLIASVLSQTDLNKNFEVVVDNTQKTLEIRYNHDNKRGWINPSNLSMSDISTIRRIIGSRVEIKNILPESTMEG